MGRMKNPRRKVIETLHGVSRRLRDTRDMWEFHGRKLVYSDRASGGPRPREAHEYPENKAAWWGDLHRRLTEEMLTLDALRAEADRQYHKIKNGE